MGTSTCPLSRNQSPSVYPSFTTGTSESDASLTSSLGVPVVRLGYTGGDRFRLNGNVDLPVSQISDVWNNGLEAASG